MKHSPFCPHGRQLPLTTGFCLTLLALSPFGCGGASPHTSEPATPAAAAASASAPAAAADQGCPVEPDVSMVLPVTTKDGLRWMVHEREVEGDDVLLGESDGDARLLTSEEAGKFVSSQPTAVWVYVKDEAPPCRMEIGAPWAIQHGDGPPTTHIAYELTGNCPLDRDAFSYVALRGVEEPLGCRLHKLPTIGSDENGTGTPPVPKEVAAVLPDQKCEEPGCFRWLYLGAHVDQGAGIFEVAAVWIHPPEGDDPACSAPFDGFHGVFFRSGRDAAWRELPGTQDVRALMYDERGLHAVLTDSHGVLGLFKTAGDDLPVKSSERRYMSWNEENRSQIEELEPSCL
jgi:hypothetical protein